MPPRRSKRKRMAVDYARLDETETADSSKLHYRRLAKLLLNYPETAVRGSSVAVLTPQQLSKYVHSTGFRFPCVVRGSPTAVQDLGMRLPERELTVKQLAEMVGLERQIRTIDVATQLEGPIYSMEEWVDYFYSRNPKKRLLNVVSLDLSGSPVQEMVRIPALVKELDLIEKAWPHNVLPIPQVQLYALMSVANCFMDFHLDFGGSSVWYHVISGCKVFLLVPPTRENLIMFEEWASSEKQASIFFGDRASGCHKLKLSAGDTLFLPGGWPHSVVTPVDSLVLGGNFLTGYNLSLQFEIWNMEERMKVRPKFRFPMYKQLMWHTALYYVDVLRNSGNRASQEISRWEYEGILSLWRSLQSWLQQQSRYVGDIPEQVTDAAATLHEIKASLEMKVWQREGLDCKYKIGTTKDHALAIPYDDDFQGNSDECSSMDEDDVDGNYSMCKDLRTMNDQ